MQESEILKKYKPGDSFTCIRNSVKVAGKIQFEGGHLFLCQDTIQGNECKDKLGYTCSYQYSSLILNLVVVSAVPEIINNYPIY